MTSPDWAHGCSAGSSRFVRIGSHLPWLRPANCLSVVMTGLVGVFIPFGKTMDLIFAMGGTLLFSGYIVYDTYMINKRLSPDEYIMGAISLYLEYVLLCYHVLFLGTNAALTVSSTSVRIDSHAFVATLANLFSAVIYILRLLNNLQRD